VFIRGLKAPHQAPLLWLAAGVLIFQIVGTAITGQGGGFTLPLPRRWTERR